MKLKKALFVLESIESVKARWKKGMSGKLRSPNDFEIISVGSWDTLSKLMSPARLRLLASIFHHKPASVAALARLVKRDFKNVYGDVMLLADVGLIDLRVHGNRKTLMPVAKVSGVEFSLSDLEVA